MNHDSLPFRLLRGAEDGLNTAGGFLTKKRRPYAVYLAAFFLPFVLLGIMWIAGGVLGGRMILAHDQWHQYYPFYLVLRDKLQSGGSMLYSWVNGMGTNYLSMYAYYLSSPLNYVAALLPDSLVLAWYTLAVLIRISCAGLFCVIFLKRIFGRCDFTLPFFGLLYAFCAYIAGYYWNSIWLETVALLPLVALGTVELLRDGKFVLYITMLALSIFCSYYIGLFICIFTLLLFICYNVCFWDGFGVFMKRFGRIAGCTVIALGLTAVLTLPAYFGLKATSSAANKFPEGFKINIGKDQNWLGVADALRQIIANQAVYTTPTSMTGLPNIFCGVTTLILALLYFTRREIKLREKICCGFLLAFFVAGFISRQLDYILHGFHFPNMLPHRFSFLFSFVLIYMAYRSWLLLGTLKSKSVLITGCLLLVFLACAISANGTLSSVLTVFIVLSVICLLYLASGKRVRKNALCVLLCFFFLAEACVSMGLGVSEVGTTDAKSYPKNGEDVQAVLQVMKEKEADTTGLYRAEMTQTHTLNDNALNVYNGVSTFSSAAYSGVSGFMKSAGLAASVAGNRYSYRNADPFVNMLLGVKYLIDRDGKQVSTTWCEEAARSGKVLLLENTAWLPMGVALSDEILDYDSEKRMKNDCDANLNLLYQQLAGTYEKLYTRVSPTGFESGKDGETAKASTYKYTVSGTKAGSVLYDIAQDCEFCLYLYTSEMNNVTVEIRPSGSEDFTKQASFSAKYAGMYYAGRLNAGDTVKVSAAPKSADKDGSITTYGDIFDGAKFDALYAELSKKTMRTTFFSDTRVEGTVDMPQDGILFTTIPYDSGWSAVVDGRSSSTVAACGAFVAIRLSQGEHTVSLTYEPQGYRLGLVVSLLCLAVFLVMLTVMLIRKVMYVPMKKVSVSMNGYVPELPAEEEDENAPEPAEEQPEPPQTPSSVSDETQLILPGDRSTADILKEYGLADADTQSGTEDAQPEAAPQAPSSVSDETQLILPGDRSTGAILKDFGPAVPCGEEEEEEVRVFTRKPKAGTNPGETCGEDAGGGNAVDDENLLFTEGNGKPVTCPFCGNENEAGFLFCTACGSKLPPQNR